MLRKALITQGRWGVNSLFDKVKSALNLKPSAKQSPQIIHSPGEIGCGLASGKAVTGTLLANAGDKHWIGNQEAFGGEYHVVHQAPFAQCLTTRTGQAFNPQTESFVVLGFAEKSFGGWSLSGKAEPLRASGGCLGSGSETLVVQGTQDPCISRDTAFTVGRNNGQENVIAIAGNTISRDAKHGGNGTGYNEDNVSHTLTKSDIHAVAYSIQSAAIGRDGTNDQVRSLWMDNITPTLTCADRHAVAYTCVTKQQAMTCLKNMASTLTANDYKEPQAVSAAYAFRACGQDGFTPAPIAPPILSSTGGGSGVPSVQIGYAVRRLMPVECERLQGFPDGYTKIPYRNKSADDCADAGRYKALGNSMAVPVMAWIGRQIESNSND